MNEIQWGIWTRTSSEAGCRRVLVDVVHELDRDASGIQITPYPKISGHRVYFRTASSGEAWAGRVLDTIQAGLRVGRGWLLTGDAENELAGWSNESSVPGVVSASWDLVRNSSDEA